MATNLRLRPEAEQALRAEAQRTGRSQQDIIREAVDRHLGVTTGDRPSGGSDREAALASRLVRPARLPYRKVTPSIRLPKGTTSLDLLGRDDRL